MPLSPLEARSRVNEQVTVEMLVKAAKNCPHCSQIFLDSEEDHHDPKNFAVAVTETGKSKFEEAKIDDPASHFQGKATVTLGDDRHEAKPGTWVHMPAGLRHSIQAKTPVVMLLLLLK